MSIITWFTNKVRRIRTSPAPLHAQPRRQRSYVCIDVAGAAVRKDGGITLDTTIGTQTVRGSSPSYTPLFASRLVFGEEIRKSHSDQMRSLSTHDQSMREFPDLRLLVVPAIRAWFLGKSKIDVVELGPAYTTAVPEALSEMLSSYTAVDFSAPYLKKQLELLAQHPHLLARSRQIAVDTYDLQLPDSSCDLLVTSCHPPLVSASTDDKCLVIDKIHALLRTGGYLVVFPWYFAEQQMKVNKHLLQRFALRRIAYQQGVNSRLLLVLQKQ